MSRARVAPWIVPLAFGAWMAMAFYARWRLFDLGMDFGYFSQAAHLISRFEDPYIHYFSVPFLGDHAHITFFVMALPARLVPPALWLPLVQLVALTSSAIPLLKLARRESLPALWTTLALALFFMHPALHNAALRDFHPECIVVPLYLWAMWAALEDRWWIYGICVGIALLTKENQAIVLLFFSLWLIVIRRRPRPAVLTASAAVAWSVVWTPLLARLNGGRYRHFDVFEAYGPTPFAALKGMLRNPGRVVVDLAQQDNVGLLLALLVPLAFLPLLAPDRLLPALGFLVANMLATTDEPHGILFQYQLPVLPFLAAAAVAGLARLHASIPDRRILVLPVVTAAVLGWMSWSDVRVSYVFRRQQAEERAMEQALAQVRSTDAVVATDDFGARLGNRRDLYLFPDMYLHGEQVPMRARIDWLLINRSSAAFASKPDVAPRVLEAVTRTCGFTLTLEHGHVVAYKRTSRPQGCAS